MNQHPILEIQVDLLRLVIHKLTACQHLASQLSATPSVFHSLSVMRPCKGGPRLPAPFEI